jgi:hypothetical protein
MAVLVHYFLLRSDVFEDFFGVRLLRGVDHSVVAFFSSSYFYFYLCASLRNLDILVMKMLGIIDIFMKLIYFLYKKTCYT